MEESSKSSASSASPESRRAWVTSSRARPQSLETANMTSPDETPLRSELSSATIFKVVKPLSPVRRLLDTTPAARLEMAARQAATISAGSDVSARSVSAASLKCLVVEVGTCAQRNS